MKTLTVEFTTTAAQHVNHQPGSVGEYQGHQLTWRYRYNIADGAELHVVTPCGRYRAMATSR